MNEGSWCALFTAAICRPGNDLLSHALRRSTIGAEEFNGRVRDGIGFRLLAIITEPANHRRVTAEYTRVFDQSPPRPECSGVTGMGNENDQTDRAISTR